MVELDFPLSIDIFPTASCNLRCSFCWGPEHNIPDALDTDGWKKVINFFSSRGTNAIVFSGGEPLIREDIGELIRFSKGSIMGVGEHGENKVVGNFIDASEDEIMKSIRDLHIDEKNDRVAQLRQR